MSEKPEEKVDKEENEEEDEDISTTLQKEISHLKSEAARTFQVKILQFCYTNTGILFSVIIESLNYLFL